MRFIAKTSDTRGIVGESTSMREVGDRIQQVAPSNATVLIKGESGTGKELVARAVHFLSQRRNGPFVALNCGVITETLAESELFGHERGAFTGAVSKRAGKFEAAGGGTLFLDEIGDMSLGLQTKLLRVLQEKRVERIGENRQIEVDVRILAATHRDLEAGVQEGWFREDLYYRLNVVPITVPPLRDRTGDIPMLADHFLARHADNNEKGNMILGLDAHDVLMRHSFPGNVRELENLMERLVVLSTGPVITAKDLPEEITGHSVKGDGVAAGYNGAGEAVNKALSSITIGGGGEGKPWHKTLRDSNIEDIGTFLAGQNEEWFKRSAFALFLQRHSPSGRDKYKTAGVYLKLLKESRILVHNGKRANRSRYRLAERYCESGH